jgi:signal transduction histidine kinase
MAHSPTGGLTPARAVALAATAGAAVTLLSVLPASSVAYRSSTFHVAIETAATLIALLGAFLLMGRFGRSRVRAELVLAASLLMLGLTNLCFAVIPWIVEEQPGSFDTWVPVVGRLLGAAGLAAGALMPSDTVHNPRRLAGQALAAVLGALVAIGLAGALLASHLPVGIDPNLPPDPSGPELVGTPALLVSQAVSMLLYAVAAFGFVRRAESTGDELMSWLAGAATLAAFSRLNYFLFPSATSEWVYTGDFLRVGAYVLILVGALREVTTYQRELAEIAVYGERRRIARDLHDGLAQELAFIRSQAHRLGPSGDEPARQIARAAERALEESRHAIATLARPVGSSLDGSVAHAAGEVAERDGVELRLQLEPGLEAADAVHEALTRIVREALGNAIRHGGARSVTVTLTGANGLRLTVEDDGRGISGEGTGSRGFGLVSMRERAEALGGTMRVTSAEGPGARVEVWLP